MDCNKVQDMMSLYMDDQLSVDEKKLFEEHIASCEDCKEELDFMQTIMNNVNDLNEEKELPEDFHENLMVKIDRINSTRKQNTSKISRLNNLRRYYTAAAAVFVVVLIFGFIGISNLNQYKRNTENYSTNEASDTAKKDSSKSVALEKSSTADTSKDAKTMDKSKSNFNEDKEDKKEEIKDEQQENDQTFGTAQSDDAETKMAPTRITVEDSLDGKAAETENYQLEVSSEEKMDDSNTSDTGMVKDEPKSDNVVQNVEFLDGDDVAIEFDEGVGAKSQYTSVRGEDNVTNERVTNEIQEPEENNQWIIGTVILIVLCLLLLLIIIFRKLKKK